MIQVDRLRVSSEDLRRVQDPGSFEFECTDELTPLTEFIGQDRALRSLQFGLGLERSGYNIFVTGLTGTGKATAILEYIQRTIEDRRGAGELTLPDDWCYVHNFDEPDRPNVLRLPLGAGRSLRNQLEELLSAVRSAVGRAFESEEYERRRREILEESQHEGRTLMERAQNDAESQGFRLRFSPMGVSLVPTEDGKPLTAEQVAELEAAARNEIEARQQPIMETVEEVGRRLRAIERESSQGQRHLDHQVGDAALAGLFDSIVSQHETNEEVVQFLQQLREFTLANLDMFRERDGQPNISLALGATGPQPDPFLAYRCKVLVDSYQATGPPIIVESNPTWTNLFGKIERRAFLGTYVSDHTMLKPGAIHRANGGYIILNLVDLLMRPGTWDGLKRLIRTKQVCLEDPMEQYGLLTPQALRPEPIPVDLKLVVTGDPLSYFLLSTHEEEFWEMFKVKADFDVQIPLTPENALAYAGFICACGQRDGLRPFDRTAVARVVEQGSRMVEDQEKLSGRFGQLRDLIVEADYWAGQAGSSTVNAQHVDRAVGEKIYRLSLIEERIRELITRGVIMVDVTGSVVGQLNGLSVLSFGDFSFGRPSRITARTFAGQRGVISIDRESQLSGHIHDKGVLILSGYLGWMYAQDKPLSVSASVSFEQAYEPLEGDSAALAELCTILSSLADAPLRQDLAVTGSVNQQGEVQPVGAVNQKVEGFHDLCRVMGFSGDQGVIIPAHNRHNLMVREDVVESVRRGRFHVFAVHTVDEAIELLTGLPAGERQPDGTYPEASIHGRADARLRELGETIRRFGRQERSEREDGGEEKEGQD